MLQQASSQEPGSTPKQARNAIFSAAEGRIIFVDCSKPVQPERAVAWARNVLHELGAQRVVVLASLQVCYLSWLISMNGQILVCGDVLEHSAYQMAIAAQRRVEG